VTGRVEQPAFREALALLKYELGLTTAQLVALAANNGAAARVEQPAFRAALVRLQPHVGNEGITRLMRGNNVFCSRICDSFVEQLIRIAEHVAPHGCDLGETLYTLLGKSVPVMDKVRELANKVTGMHDRATIEKFVKSMRGDLTKRAMMAERL
jgi:hypothetical protein